MAIRPDADGNVPVAGLLVPAPLVPRIVAAVRGLYPSVTEAKDDDAAVRAWLKYIVAATLAQHESAQAVAPVQDALQATREEYEQRAIEAHKKALRDADMIVESAAPLPPVTPP